MSALMLGPYRVVRTLGEGGMGRVYEAVNDQLGRRVAIKVLHADLASAPHLATRFLNEARAVNIVQHPSIVAVSEFGQAEDGTPYMVMEYLEGESLAQRITNRGRLPDGLPIIRQVAGALAAAHAKDIIHRDLKPANIMIVPDPEAVGGERAKVLDFGVAKLDALSVQERMLRTQTGALMGTPAYMSPEQCRSATATTDRSDVYSLGIIAYEMFSGSPPFQAVGLGDLLALHLYTRPPQLKDRAPWVPQDIADLVHAMLAKKPTERPSMAEVAELLGARPAVMPAPPTGPGAAGPGLTPSVQKTQVSDAPAMTGHGERPPSGETLGPVTRIVLAMPRRGGLLRLLGPAAAAVLCALLVIGVVRLRRGGPRTAGPGERASPQHVQWHVDSTPPAAQIIRVSDGAMLGLTPWSSEEEPSEASTEVVLRLAGYHDWPLTLDGQKDQARYIILRPLPAPRSDAPDQPPAGGARMGPEGAP